MRVCFVVGEIFNWGRYGGFGSLTRTIGKYLVKKGVEVYILLLYNTPEKHKMIEKLDDMIVLSPEKRNDPSLYKACDADIYHSQDASTGTYYAQKANPSRKHLVTFQDPMYLEELIASQWSFTPKWENPLFRIYSQIKWKASEYFVKKAVHNADAVFSQANFVIPKTVTMYNLTHPPAFLPNPVEIPDRNLKKADKPTVCFLGRWDPVKRIELFFEMAKKYPNITFIAMGIAHDKQRDSFLKKRYGDLPNIILPGFVSEAEKSKILEQSWVLINTSLRECLPVSFLEASAHKCAILSNNNPDNFASEYGYYVTDGKFSEGLEYLIKNDIWKEQSEKGFKYVNKKHELKLVINQHYDLYRKILD